MIIQQPKVSASSLGLDKAVFADVVPRQEEVCEEYSTYSMTAAAPSGDMRAYFIKTSDVWLLRYINSSSTGKSYYTSTDKGLTWTSRTLPNLNCTQIIYIESLNRFAYMAGNYFYYSSDAINWTSVSISFDSTSSSRSLHWNESKQKFVCICYGAVYEGNATGSTWTKVKTLTGSYRYVNEYAEYGDYYIGVSQYSTDDDGPCKIWFINKNTYAEKDSGISTGTIYSNEISFVQVYNDILFVGFYQCLRTFKISGTTLTALSGSSLTSAYNSSYYRRPASVFYDDVNQRYLAVFKRASSGTNAIYSSPDAATWTLTEYSADSYTILVHREDGKLYILGNTQTMCLYNNTLYDGVLTLGKGGNVLQTISASPIPKIVTGTYTGANKAQTLTFDSKPMLVIVRSNRNVNSGDCGYLILIQGCQTTVPTHATSSNNVVSVTWSDNSVTWQHYSQTAGGTYSGIEYIYLAFLE